MNASMAYATALDSIGAYVERIDGGDVMTVELQGGFLVSLVLPTGQEVLTLEAPDLLRLQADAQRHKSRDARFGPRARLRAVGHYLDGCHAAAVVVQQSGIGYAVEYSGLPAKSFELEGVTRIQETLDDQRLMRLAKTAA